MTPTSSARLGLLIDPDGTISNNEFNWKRTDETAGIMYGTKAVPPPAASLYDGALVAETDTEVIHRVSGTPGSYTKTPMYYPWVYCGTNQGISLPNSGSTPFGWDTFSSVNSVNSSQADNMGPGPLFGFKVSIKGLYLIRIMLRWEQGVSSTTGNRRVFLQVNGSLDSTNWETDNLPVQVAGYSYSELKFTRLLQVNDIVAAAAAHGSTTTPIPNNYSQIWATLLNPVV